MLSSHRFRSLSVAEPGHTFSWPGDYLVGSGGSRSIIAGQVG